MRKYFLTGGTGFIGREIVRQILKRDDTEAIVLLTRNPQRRYDMLGWDRRITLYEGDITKPQFPTSKFTDLIHGANEVNDTLQPDQMHYYYTIVHGTENIMRWAGQAGVERILFLSSGAAGRDTLYGSAKRVSEHLCQYYQGPTKIARIYSVIGPEMPVGRDAQYAACKFVWQAVYQKRVCVYGGSSRRTYLDVSDCARWLLHILDHGALLSPIDVAGDEEISIYALAQLVGFVFGASVERVLGPDRIDMYVPDRYWQDKLGLKQTITIRDSLERIRDAYRKDTPPAKAA